MNLEHSSNIVALTVELNFGKAGRSERVPWLSKILYPCQYELQPNDKLRPQIFRFIIVTNLCIGNYPLVRKCHSINQIDRGNVVIKKNKKAGCVVVSS